NSVSVTRILPRNSQIDESYPRRRLHSILLRDRRFPRVRAVVAALGKQRPVELLLSPPRSSPEQLPSRRGVGTRARGPGSRIRRAQPLLEISKNRQSMIRYYVTDRRRGDVLGSAARAVRDGVDMIQVREKDLSARELLDTVCRIRDLAAGSTTRILVNDRID